MNFRHFIISLVASTVTGKAIIRSQDKIDVVITDNGEVQVQRASISDAEELDQTAVWTAATQNEVKSLLFNGFQINPYPSAIDGSVSFSAARVLRLSFHDCLKSSTGIGGCDGCLYYPAPNVEAAENAGLTPTTDYLEALYQNATLSSQGGRTLRAAGSSRADLWAFAAFAAVEFTTRTHNEACSGNRNFTKSVQCLSQEGEAGCEINMSFVNTSNWFVAGRRDCTPVKTCLATGKSFSAGYMTCQKSTFPSNDLNGTQLQLWFQKNFAFNASELVAIMGAHTIGSFHEAQTGFKYSWTSRSEGSFDNQYYRNLAALDDWQFTDDKCYKVGTAFGLKPHGRWMTKANLNTNFKSPGPLQWILEKHTGPNCNAAEDLNWTDSPGDDITCKNVNRRCCPRFWDKTKPWSNPAMTIADNSRASNSDSVLADNRTGGRAYMGMGLDTDGGCGISNGDCERYRIIVARDDASITADLAMYLSFELDSDGFPSGPTNCITGIPSSDRWANWTRYRNKTDITTKSRFNFQSCPKYLPLSQHVDIFAQDQAAWVKVFMPTLRKMLANGVVWQSR